MNYSVDWDGPGECWRDREETMTQFEYTSVLHPIDETVAEATERFNSMGKNGWQLVYMFATAREARIWFMREISTIEPVTAEQLAQPVPLTLNQAQTILSAFGTLYRQSNPTAGGQ
jgi:hypothetical protein